MSLPSRVGNFVRSLSRAQRELAVLGLAAFLGFVVMPGLTWAIGIVVFKTYAGGNTVFSLYGNFYKAIAAGAPVFWIVAAGPYLLIQVMRLLIALFRGGARQEKKAAPAPQPKRRAPQLPDDMLSTPEKPDTRRTAPQSTRPAPETRRAAPNRAPPSAPAQPSRTPPPPPATPSPRKAPLKPGERRTPFIKSID